MPPPAADVPTMSSDEGKMSKAGRGASVLMSEGGAFRKERVTRAACGIPSAALVCSISLIAVFRKLPPASARLVMVTLRGEDVATRGTIRRAAAARWMWLRP